MNFVLEKMAKSLASKAAAKVYDETSIDTMREGPLATDSFE